MVGPDIGGVEGLCELPCWGQESRLITLVQWRDWRGMLRQESWRDRVDRAFTGDTLVRTEAVKNIRMAKHTRLED